MDNISTVKSLEVETDKQGHVYTYALSSTVMPSGRAADVTCHRYFTRLGRVVSTL